MKTIRIALILTLLGLGFYVHAQSSLTNGLVVFYPFSGNANDMTGNGNDGTIVNATLTGDRLGNPNQAFLFNGSNSWIQTSGFWPALGSNAVSASCWIYYQGGVPISYYQSTMMNWGGDGVTFGSRFQFRLTDGGNNTTTLCVDGVGNGSVANTSIPSYKWVHVAVVRPPSGGLNDMMFFVNGRQVPTIQQSDNSVFFNIIASNPLAIGRGEPNNPYNAHLFFDGSIDEVRLYNRALSTNEVAQIYALEAPTYLNLKKAVYLDSFTMKIGTNYQVQVSGNLINWTNWGSSFTATNNYWATTNYWNVDDWNQLFFRLQVVP